MQEALRGHSGPALEQSLEVKRAQFQVLGQHGQGVLLLLVGFHVAQRPFHIGSGTAVDRTAPYRRTAGSGSTGEAFKTFRSS